ncbi:MAG: hypothetical protein IAF02_22105, partial [Anaerolineae bacterium]|nr:hypothetical protein [Anaerolineae bacterium]
MKNRKFWMLFSMLIVFALALAACGGGDTAEPTEAPAMEEETAVEEPAEEVAPTEEAPAEEAAMPEMALAAPAGGFLERAMAGEFSGTSVTVDGPFTNPDDVLFMESMKAFEDATGITVNYIGDKEFEGRISIAVDAGNPPDIADFPQPGLLANFVR